MRFSIKSNLYGRWGVHVELSEYDAVPPVQNIAYEASPLKLNPEVEAAALTLLFGRFSGGEMEFAHKVGPNTAYYWICIPDRVLSESSSARWNGHIGMREWRLAANRK